jgi:shikimate kinase
VSELVQPNAILIGFRGTGKSSIAELIALCTNRTLFRMDEEIVKRAGRPVAEIVRTYGWETFWDLESLVATEASMLRNAVIDTGGGVIRRDVNMEQLRATGKVFWLTADVATIKERLQDQHDRPSLTGNRSFLDEVEEVLEGRLPLYRKWADYIVHTDGRQLGEIADEIVHELCGE